MIEVVVFGSPQIVFPLYSMIRATFYFYFISSTRT